jgi:hypothetical protein
MELSGGAVHLIPVGLIIYSIIGILYDKKTVFTLWRFLLIPSNLNRLLEKVEPDEKI